MESATYDDTGGGVYDEAKIEAESDYSVSGSAESPVNAPIPAGELSLQSDKIIKSAFVSLETNSFDDDKTQMENLVKDNDGFIQSSNLYGYNDNRRYEVTLRVPGENYEAVKKAVEALGRLVSSSESSENVSGEYYDLESRLKTKIIEEERVLAMIEKAYTAENLLALEKFLAEIRTDIEIYKSRMNDIDNLSSYSTITVTLTEQPNVRISTGATPFGLRLSNSFMNSINNTISFFENILVFLAGALIPLVIIGLLIIIGIAAYRRAVKKRGHSSN
jgi:hypothetical protein